LVIFACMCGRGGSWENGDCLTACGGEVTFLSFLEIREAFFLFYRLQFGFFYRIYLANPGMRCID
jgi:hypothetical protein